MAEQADRLDHGQGSRSPRVEEDGQDQKGDADQRVLPVGEHEFDVRDLDQRLDQGAADEHRAGDAG